MTSEHQRRLKNMTPPIYSNNSTMRITNPIERYTWATYFILIITLSLIGDTLILIASSSKYKAIQLHKVIVTIMQHMAVCDILTALAALYGPVAMIADGEVLGKVACYLSTFIVYLSFPTSFLLISAITTTKMWLVKYPLHCSGWSTRRSHVICVACWLFAATVDVAMVIVDKDDISFKYKGYKCDYHFSARIWKWLRPVLTIFTSLLPSIVAVIATLMLLLEARKVAKRGRGTLRWQGMTTVILTAVFYCLSIFPFSVYLIAGPHVTQEPTGWFHLQFYRCAWSILILSVVSNFYIYLLTVTSFRDFVLRRFPKATLGIFVKKFNAENSVYKFDSPKSRVFQMGK
ncbi:hypothetical protein ACHWQZ_G007261 [Mnemiopsis leidyi]